MPIDLSAARLKIARAKKHLIDFEREKVAFLGTDPYTVIPRFDRERNVTESVVGPLPTIPADMPLLAADAAHNFRVALDYLACELVRANGAVPTRVYFPICESMERYESESPGKTKGMSTEAKRAIDRLKPYGGGNNLLWALHLLDITDKHRLLAPVGTMISRDGSIRLKLSPEPTDFNIYLNPEPLREGNVVGEVSGDSGSENRIFYSFDIAFEQPQLLAKQPVLDTLRTMGQTVEAIIDYFEH